MSTPPAPSRPLRKPELMSPAGHWPQLRAAVEAGADAVFFGLPRFTARAKVGFTEDELPDAMRALHARGVKGFVTFNTLVFDRELEDAERAIATIAEAGTDAIIVQDVAVAALAREVAPGLEVHGSTQMSITSAQGAELARSLGCTRVVLGRELSLQDIGRIAAATDVELEVFVHGALCVSYSGQCFSSEAWGGRSANRGKCAQACRLEYGMIVDGEPRDLGDARYLLSPGDLYALEQVPELMRLGVDCFKIEGRYKDAEYVALTTRAYREAIDAAWEGRDARPSPETREALEGAYSRGLGPHFLAGTDHQAVVRGRAPRHRGVRAGTVERAGREGITVRLEPRLAFPLAAGDGVVVDAASWRSPEEREEGGRVWAVEPLEGGRALLRFEDGRIDARRIRAGDLLWRTHSPATARLARPFTDAADPVSTRPLRVRVTARAGEPLRAVAIDEAGRSVEAVGEARLEPARKRALGEEMVRAQFGRLGGTPFHLEAAELDAPEPLFVPVSELNVVRRVLVEALLAERGRAPERGTRRVVRERVRALGRPAPVPADEPARLHLLVRTDEQLGAALALEPLPASVTLDYLELYGLRPAVERARAAGVRVRVASPRVLKPTEQNLVRFLSTLAGLGAEVLVRSGGLLRDLAALPDGERPALTGDFSLNAANALAAARYLEAGCAAITPTFDLNGAQVAELAARVDPRRIEAIAYGHLPVFHTEHCVFCRFLSDGTDYTDCGKPCERHRVSLEDRRGRRHPVMADVGCRNTVFGAEAQIAARHLPAWLAAGLRDLRLEFTHESGEDATRVTELFRGALEKGPDADFDALERELARTAPGGVTEGSLFVPMDFSELPQLI